MKDRPFSNVVQKHLKQSERVSSILKNVTVRSRSHRTQSSTSKSYLQVSFDEESDYKLEYVESLNDPAVSNEESKCEQNDQVAWYNTPSTSKKTKEIESTQPVLQSPKNIFGDRDSDKCSSFTQLCPDINKTPNTSKVHKAIGKSDSDLTFYTPKSTLKPTPTAKLYSVYKACLSGEKDFNDLFNVTSRRDSKRLFSSSKQQSSTDLNETPGRKTIQKENKCIQQKRIALQDESSFNPIHSSTKFCFEQDLNCSKTPVSKIPPPSVLSGIKQLRTPGRRTPLLPANNNIRIANKFPQDDDDDIPCTQPVSTIVLRGVVAYVEVRCDKQDYSSGVKAELLELGAEISNTFTRKVTHVVFKEGRLSTYKKAKQWGVKMVCVMWIEACRNAQTVLLSNGFTPSKSEDYNRKMLEQQGQESNGSTDKKQREFKIVRPKRVKKQLNLAPPAGKPSEDPTSTDEPEPQKKTMVQMLLSLAGEGIGDFFNHVSTSPTSEEDFCFPVSVKLLRKYLSPRKAETDVKQHMNDIDKYCNLTARGRKRLARLLFPDEKDSTSQGEGRTSDGGEEEEEVSDFPSASNVEPMRKSAPARIVTGKKNRREQQVAITDFLKAGVAEGHIALRPKLKENRDPQSKSTYPNEQNVLSQKNCTGKGKRLLENKGKVQEKIDKFINLGRPVEAAAGQAEGVNDDANEMDTSPEGGRDCVSQTVKKRKLLPLDDPIPQLVHKSLNTCDENQSMGNPYATQYHKLKKKRISTSRNENGVSQIGKPNKRKKNSDDENKENINHNCSRRSSSSFFVTKRNSLRRRTSPGIVCTGMQTAEIQAVKSTIDELGGFQMEKTVSANTTHVVAYQKGYRTVNLLKGIARGCWIVNFDWVMQSKAAGKWLLEEPHEFTHFSPAVKKYRLERQAFGMYFSMDLFKECGLINVSPAAKPPMKDLKELIMLCGGRVTNNSRAADLLIGGQSRTHDTVFRVSEKWVLDSITKDTLFEIDKYIVSATEQS